jgi:hypothetical protein
MVSSFARFLLELGFYLTFTRIDTLASWNLPSCSIIEVNGKGKRKRVAARERTLASRRQN